MRHHPHFFATSSSRFTSFASSWQSKKADGSKIRCSSLLPASHRVLLDPGLPNKALINTCFTALSRRDLSSLTLYDSLSESYKSLPLSISKEGSGSTSENSAENANVGLAWYTCGPTVYDSAHLGHARTYVSLDIIKRALLYNYNLQSSMNSQSSRSKERVKNSTTPIIPPPIFIMNITDVDDKILARAKERNVPPLQLAREFEKEFWEDMDALNVMRPTVVTRVTDYVESSIIPYIEQIERNGMAYVIENDGVYFDVGAFESRKGDLNRYGKLSSTKRDTSSDVSENDTIDVEEPNQVMDSPSKKRDPRDFVLWKRRESTDTNEADNDTNNQGEELCWDSPWGRGRPGWHIECSAMIESTMKSFDQHQIHVHAGGTDLKFPHHTNEIAQAEAYHNLQPQNDKEWIPHWVHTGHLHIDGLKMSKSLKNFITIRDILKASGSSERGDCGNDMSRPFHSPADDFRLWCLGLSGSYRGPATYSRSRLEEARVTREKILRFLLDGEQWLKQANSSDEFRSYSAEWSKGDHNFVQLTSTCRSCCHEAMLGFSPNDFEGSNTGVKDGFDFDGSTYLKSMVDLAEAGSDYISKTVMDRRPLYPVQHALCALRDCLAIVGFSDNTVRAGLSQKVGDNDLGGNEDLVNELAQFRSRVRNEALEYLRSSKLCKDSSAVMLSKTLLRLCDELRDENLPQIGIEVFDGDASPSWRFGTQEKASSTSKRSTDDAMRENVEPVKKGHHHVHVPDELNFFQVGKYKGSFSAFDAHGTPTHDVDGSELSKRMIKKLIKKREAFFRKKMM